MTTQTKMPVVPITELEQSAFCQTEEELESKSLVEEFAVGVRWQRIPKKYLGLSPEIIGKRIFLKMDNKEFLFNFNHSIYSNYLSGEILEKSNKITIKFLENKNTFNEEEWAELYKLSENTYVEETDDLKQKSAGAGLTDND